MDTVVDTGCLQDYNLLMSRKETIADNDIVHILNRGVKKLPIFRQRSDLWRMVYSLFFLNSKNVPENWFREAEKIGALNDLKWPKEWKERKPLVSILAFTIMPNHFHFILKQTAKGGIQQFMHKFTMSYSKFINSKYAESGSLFQGKFKSVIVDSDEFLRYLACYVMVKNTFELFSGGFPAAINNFDTAWKEAFDYPFSSLTDYAGLKNSAILDKNILGEIFTSTDSFKNDSRDLILGQKLDIIDHGFNDY